MPPTRFVHLSEYGLDTLVSLPESAAGAGAPSPVLCFLHGWGEAAPLDIVTALTRHGPLHPGSSQRASKFLVVAPQLRFPGGDVWHSKADLVREIVTAVCLRYQGDPCRTYLTGFSFGGNGVLDLALQHRDFWAALWPVDPARVPAARSSLPLLLSLGQYSRGGQWERFIRECALQDLALNAQGYSVLVDCGFDHVGAATRAYRDDRAYDWLLGKCLPVPGSTSERHDQAP
jgi:hypothetical protein